MRNRNCWIAFFFLVLLTFAGGHRLLADDAERQQWAETKAKLSTEGWNQIDQGVFERRLGPGKIEHLGYGREGYAWTIGELRRQLDSLKETYQRYPSEDLAKVIDQLSVKIALAELELRNMPQKMSSIAATVAGASCSSICYSATADAYPLTTTQGVGAVADAKFNSTCGYSGDAYAYAYAIATLNGTTTTITQADPHTGTNVTSHAAASVNGGSISGTPCSSNANSYALSSALGISYSTSATNSSCPPVVTPTVAINGPSEVDFTTATCATRTWTAMVSNCTAPVTYQWKFNGSNVGTNSSSYSRSVCYNTSNFTLSVTATCSNGSATATYPVTVVYEPDTCGIDCRCGGPGQPICP
jgi:hypothetical protein